MQSQDLKAQFRKLERQLLTIYAIGFVILVALSLVSNFLMKDQAARQATSMIKRTVAQDPREAVLTLNDAKLDYFTAVVYFDQDGRRIFSLPANLDPEIISHPSIWERFSTARIENNLNFNERGKKKVGSVLYIFNRFSHVQWAFFIWVSFMLATLPVVRNSRIAITKNYKRDVKLLEESTRAELAQRVRHDIRSPLGALKVATQDLSDLTERRKRIIKKATARIDEIVAELELIRNGNERSGASIIQCETQNTSLLTIVQDIVQEKRTRLSDMQKRKSGPVPPTLIPEFSKDAFFLFAVIDAANMKRALSNVIENAIEVCGKSDRIHVQLYSENQQNIIAVNDSGPGISPKHLPHVTEKGFTLGKENGSGLGLYYARRDIEAIGGRLEVQSEVGQGTTVRIFIPAHTPPPWYRKTIEIPKDGYVVILDDQEVSGLTLRERIEGALHGRGSSPTNVRIENFSSSDELVIWHRAQSENTQRTGETLYLLDFDLGKGKKTGLDIAEELELSKNAILVTGHFDSREIQERCEQLKIGLIPKSYLSEIEIVAV